MTHTISRGDYIDLLNQDKIIPKIIETKKEYKQFLAVAERLISKKQNRTAEENALFSTPPSPHIPIPYFLCLLSVWVKL